MNSTDGPRRADGRYPVRARVAPGARVDDSPMTRQERRRLTREVEKKIDPQLYVSPDVPAGALRGMASTARRTHRRNRRRT